MATERFRFLEESHGSRPENVMNEKPQSPARVRLTPSARRDFPDIGTREGTVEMVDGWLVVRWDRMEGTARVPGEAVEVQHAP